MYDALGSREFVEKIYANAGASLREEDARALASALDAGARTRADVLLALAEDEGFARRVYDEDFVRLHYFAFLERDPDAQGLGAWLSFLRKTGDYEGVTRAITASSEYVNKHGAR